MAIPTHTLNDGLELPALGLGTYPMKGDEAVVAIVSALDAGYRLIDTAVNYDNENEVGAAIRRSGVPRDEIIVASKIPGRHHRYDDAIASTKESLQRLGLDHLDLHLIHWPNPERGLYPQTWQALIDLQQQGLVRHVGVSNFTAEHLDRVIADTGVPPVVNQIELHPYFPQEAMLQANADRGVRTQAWSPLGKRQPPFDEPPLVQAADRLGVTAAQVILRWHVQLGSVPIPKSATPQRQRQNLDVFAFELTDDEMAAITALGRPDGRLFDADPVSHEEM